MTSYIRQLLEITFGHYLNVIILLVFTFNVFVIDSALSQPLNSLDTLEILLVDELQAKSFVTQLSIYDHVDVSELSQSEVIDLLEQANTDNLFYSGDHKVNWKGPIGTYCLMGSGFGLLISWYEYLSRVLISSNKFSVIFLPIGTAAGCFVGGLVATVALLVRGYSIDIFSES